MTFEWVRDFDAEMIGFRNAFRNDKGDWEKLEATEAGEREQYREKGETALEAEIIRVVRHLNFSKD